MFTLLTNINKNLLMTFYNLTMQEQKLVLTWLNNNGGMNATRVNKWSIYEIAWPINIQGKWNRNTKAKHHQKNLCSTVSTNWVTCGQRSDLDDRRSWLSARYCGKGRSWIYRILLLLVACCCYGRHLWVALVLACASFGGKRVDEPSSHHLSQLQLMGERNVICILCTRIKNVTSIVMACIKQ